MFKIGVVLKPLGTPLAIETLLGLSAVLPFVLFVGPWSRFDFSSMRQNISVFPVGVATRVSPNTKSYREGFHTRRLISRGVLVIS